MLGKIAALVVLIGVAVGAAACNTIEGAGKDIKAAGDAIEKSASKTKGY